MQVQSMTINNTAPQFEQRQPEVEQCFDWDKLTLSQQFSVSSLGQFGYTLAFIRFINGNSFAVLKLANKIATINVEGLINIKPNINCRS